MAAKHRRGWQTALIAVAVAPLACGWSEVATAEPAGGEQPAVVGREPPEVGKVRELKRTGPRALARPRILSFDWDAAGPTGYHACPLPDEPVSVRCTASDADGDALTISVTFQNLGPGSISRTGGQPHVFPASTNSHFVTEDFVMPSLTNVRATCRVVDSRNFTAEKSIEIRCSPPTP